MGRPGGYRRRDVQGTLVFLLFFFYFTNNYLTRSIPPHPFVARTRKHKKRDHHSQPLKTSVTARFQWLGLPLASTIIHTPQK